MRKKLVPVIVSAMMACSLFAGCGQKPAAASASAQTKEASAADKSKAEAAVKEAVVEAAVEEAVVEEAATEAVVESALEIKYENPKYDFTEAIEQQKKEVILVPDAANIDIAVFSAIDATGVQLIPSVDPENKTDYYLNAYVDGAGLVVVPENGKELASVVSSASGEIKIAEDGTATVVPASIMADAPADETITVTTKEGTAYTVHTVSELLPGMEINVKDVSKDNYGVYSFEGDMFLLRVDTAGKLVYYRDLTCLGSLKSENFAKHETADGAFYSYFVELDPDLRNARGGWSCGMFVVMDENYNEIDYATLAANDEKNHTHGATYAEYHEFVVVGKNHYLMLSFTPLLTNNLPENVKGIDGGSSAYVFAGVVQEVKDGKVVAELNTVDYPELFYAANECNAYATSTDKGVDVQLSEDNVIFSPADGYMDYAHINSLDYTLKKDGTVDKLLVSFHNLSSIAQFDMASGACDWILGGKLNQFAGFEKYASTRTDEAGIEYTCLTFGQHFARYSNKKADCTLDGNPVISVFDNQNGTGPFLATSKPIPTLTRVLCAAVDADKKTVEVSGVINGTDLNKKTGKYHISSHCGSVQYNAPTAVIIGWGLHAVIDTIGAGAPEGTMSDEGFPDLRIGSHPVVTEYDLEGDKTTFELCFKRNPNSKVQGALASYRTYKTTD